MSITRVGCHAYIYSKRLQLCSESCSFFVADKGVEMSESVSVKYCRCLNWERGIAEEQSDGEVKVEHNAL